MRSLASVLSQTDRLIALAQPTPLQRLISNSDKNKKGLIALDVAASQAATDAQGRAIKSIMATVERQTVSGFNTDLTDKIASASRASLRDVSRIVTDAWQSGYELARQHIRSEAAILGVKVDVLPPSRDYLNEILTRVQANASSVYDRIFSAVARGPDRAAVLSLLNESARDLERRASASAAVAMNRAYSETQAKAYAQIPRARKMWVTNITARTCPVCLALHGTILPMDQEFDATASFSTNPPAVFVDLELPPRHPHCRCRIVPVTPAILAESSSTYAKLQRQLGRTAKEAFGDTSNVERLGRTKAISAAQIRSLSSNEIRSLLTNLRGKL